MRVTGSLVIFLRIVANKRLKNQQEIYRKDERSKETLL